MNDPSAFRMTSGAFGRSRHLQADSNTAWRTSTHSRPPNTWHQHFHRTSTPPGGLHHLLGNLNAFWMTLSPSSGPQHLLDDLNAFQWTSTSPGGLQHLLGNLNTF
ncbi:hypothetical protein LSAT2_027685 [Lamellibrachia satsuma]|nr:hypothetical protein LSAT2_027685 [Lamellibrachia satsuma]